jgi:hypothetical protein
VTPISATVWAGAAPGAAGPEIVTGMTSVPMLDVASGVQAVVQYASSQLSLPQHPRQQPRTAIRGCDCGERCQ